MGVDLLEQRLQNLVVETPDAGQITARVLSRAATPRRHQFVRVGALAVATLALMLAVIYFVPRAAAVLADTPIAGDLLRDAGLAGAGDRVTAVGAVSTSSGYKVELVAAYADSTRTVLILHAEPAIDLGGVGSPELKDQFGRTHQFRSGMGNGLTGEVVMTFEPLAWPDAVTGARITLHWSAVEPFTCIASSTDPSGYHCSTGQLVTGSWTLLAIIGVDEGTVLALPSAGHLGSATIRFVSVVATPATIAVDVEVTGMSSEELGKMIVPEKGKFRPAFTVDLVGPDGITNLGQGAGDGSSDLLGTSHYHFWWPRGAKGDYRLRFAYEGLGQFDRALHIP